MAEITVSVADLRGKNAARDERKGGLPHQALEALRESNAWPLLEQQTLSDALALARELARNDGSTAAIVGNHATATWLLKTSFGPEKPSSSPVPLRAFVPSVLAARPTTDGWVIDGTAEVAAGGLTADRLFVTFRDAGGQAHAAELPSDTPGLERSALPEATGLRQAAGARLQLTAVSIASDHTASLTAETLDHLELVQQAARIALLVGTAEGALAEGRSYTVNKSRPWVHSGYGRHIDDPFVQRKYGDLHIRVQAAVVLAESAFARLDRALAVPEAPRPEPRVALDAAESWAGEVALSAGAGIFEVMGARSATRENGFDRFWRNARVITIDHPAEPRAEAIGSWLVDDASRSAGAVA